MKEASLQFELKGSFLFRLKEIANGLSAVWFQCPAMVKNRQDQLR